MITPPSPSPAPLRLRRPGPGVWLRLRSNHRWHGSTTQPRRPISPSLKIPTNPERSCVAALENAPRNTGKSETGATGHYRTLAIWNRLAYRGNYGLSPIVIKSTGPKSGSLAGSLVADSMSAAECATAGVAAGGVAGDAAGGRVVIQGGFGGAAAYRGALGAKGEIFAEGAGCCESGLSSRKQNLVVRGLLGSAAMGEGALRWKVLEAYCLKCVFWCGFSTC